MDKGINLQIEELKQNLVDIINEYNMPISVTTMILQGLLNESNMVKQQILAQEKQSFEESLKEENKNDDKNKSE